MSLSLAVTAGAAFNDQDKIVNTEAVEVCSALNIINGRTNGDFDPAGNVTRAEAAKMICIALNGGKEPVLSASATPIFADIAGHWAAKYIEYCVSEGIVAGKSATSFDPNGNVTGVELAKMLLIALGYNAEHGKFLGGNWDTNVNVAASQKDLYAGLETIDPAVALSRDNAAQMIWNALQALTVKYEYTLVGSNGDLNSQIKVVDTGSTLLWAKYTAKIADAGIMKGVKYDDKNDDYNTTVSTVGTFDSDVDYSALMGQNVKVVYKVKNNAFDTLYGIYATDKNQTVTALYGDATIAGDTIEIDDVEYELAAEYVTVGLNGDVIDEDDYGWENYYEVTLIDNNDDDKYDVGVGNPFDVVKVKTITTDKIYFEGIDGLKVEDCDLYDGIAKDDYVMLTGAAYTVSGLYEVVKADVISGEVTNTKTDGSIKVDGTWYGKECDASPEAGDVLSSAVVVNGYYFTYDTSASTTAGNTVVALNVNEDAIWNSDYFEAVLMFADGTVETTKAYVEVEVDDETQKLVPEEDVIYTYEKNDEGYVLTEVTNGADIDVGTAEPITGIYSAETNKVDGVRVATDAVVFVKYDGTKGEVLTGADIDAWKDATTASVNAAFVDKTVKVMYIELDSDKIPGASSDAAYAMIVSEIVAGKDDTLVADLWTAEGLVEGAVITAATGTELAENTVYEFTMDGEEYELTEVEALVGAVIDIDGNYVSVLFDGASEAVEFKMTADTANLFVDTKDSTGATSGDVTEAVEFEENLFYANIIIVVDDDDSTADTELGLIVVDLDNKLLDSADEEIVIEKVVAE